MVGAPTIVNVGYRSTNHWVISAGRDRLLIDLGWPGQVDVLLANLRRMDIPLAELRHGLATHYHIDHAGAAEDLRALGVRLVATPEQLAAIPEMTRWTKPADNYRPIARAGIVVVPLAESRAFLATLGMAGEIVHTPGHSDDSVSLVLDGGDAFTGDLTLPALATEADRPLVQTSWHALSARGVTRVHGGHGPVRQLADILRT